MKTMRAIAALVVLLFVLLVVYALTSGEQASRPVFRPTPRPAPTEDVIYARDQVEILEDWKCLHDSIGNMIVSGKVKNAGALPLQFIEIRATIFTEAGEQVNTGAGFIDSDVLQAGATSTFDVYVDDPEDEAKKCSVKVEEAYFVEE